MTAPAEVKELRKHIGHLSTEQRSQVEEAVALALQAHHGQKRLGGKPYVVHPLGVATILGTWRADQETIIAGLLHDTLEDTDLTYPDIASAFGEEVAWLVEGVTKFTQADFADQDSMDRKIETLRKLFEVMREDIRVAIIKLADRLHNVRTIDRLPADRRVRFAEETMAVYYPLAHHLGMNDLRRELSEFCIPLLEPALAKQLLDTRQHWLKKHKRTLEEMEAVVRAQDTNFALTKMYTHTRCLKSLLDTREKHRSDEAPYSLVAVAVNTDACYEILKLFHTLFKPISGRFRDCIASPTESAYQSIRTAVLSPDGELIPVRIRTTQMDEQECQGVLLKCFSEYKSIPGFSWLRRSASLDKATRESSQAFWQALQSDIFSRTIDVSIDGKQLALPVEATALDAAYALYGVEANRVNHIMINGSRAHLGQSLAQDDVVAVQLHGHEHVQFEWLRNIATSYARTIIVDSLKQRSQHEKLTIGQRLLQKELDHFKKGLIGELTKGSKQSVCDYYQRESFEEVVSLVGEGMIRARDIVFLLFPEHERGKVQDLGDPQKQHEFTVYIRGAIHQKHEALTQVLSLSRIQDITMKKTRVRRDTKAETVNLVISGSAPDRLHFADWLTALEMQAWVTDVHTRLSTLTQLKLLGAIISSFGVIVLTVLLLPIIDKLTLLPPLVRQVFPLIPILGVNHLLLKVFQRYIVTLRSDKRFIGLGFLMNLVGLLLVIFHSTNQGTVASILPLVAIFAFSILYLAYSFFQSEQLFSTAQLKSAPLTPEQWRSVKHKKAQGYLFRLGAVLVWGVTPIYLRYSPMSAIEPSVRVFFMSIGALSLTALVLLLRQMMQNTMRITKLSIPKNSLLFTIIITQGMYMYFSNASLLHTSSTNFLLFQNFAPVFALMIAAILWRHTIPYLKDPTHILWIFLIFLMGSIGSSLVIFNSIQSPGTTSVYGDMLGLVSMTFDTIVIIAQIRYMKHFSDASGIAINLTMFLWLALLTSPLMLWLYGTQVFAVQTLITRPVLYAVGAGVLFGIGLLLNYEAFRRIDGFIAFLMFNVSILITFMLEVFVLRTFSPTWLLLLGGLIIISSTILAELINSRCEKQGY